MSCCIVGCPNEGTAASKETTYHLFPHPVKGVNLVCIIISFLFSLKCLFYFIHLDVSRFKEWLAACNNPKFETMDAMAIHKRYRICRRHFDSDCLNGGCRRLLNTAIPTLYLNSSQDAASNDEDTFVYLPDTGIQLNEEPNQHFELIVPDTNSTVITKEIKGMFSTIFCCSKIH